MFKKLGVLVLSLGIFTNASASGDLETLCARYKANYGWSDYYKVQAVLIDGSDLNRRLNTLEYSSYDRYAVLSWEQNDGVSLLKLESRYLTDFIDVSAEDQKGRAWGIKKAPSYGCN